MSDSVRPHRWQATRLPRPWDSPSSHTGVGCHFLLQCMKMKVKLLSHVQLLATPWTAAHQTPLPMGFSRQEHWSGVPLPSSKRKGSFRQINELLQVSWNSEPKSWLCLSSVPIQVFNRWSILPSLSFWPASTEGYHLPCQFHTCLTVPQWP